VYCFFIEGNQARDQKQNKMITSLLQVHEVADKMFSSDSAIISVNIQTSWGLVTAFRDGTVRLAA